MCWQSLAAADSADQINEKLTAGNEVAWVIEHSTDKHGDLAVLFTARLKGNEPARFPYLVRGDLRPAETDALNGFDEASGKIEDRVVQENVIVSLKEKRVLGRLDLGKPEDQAVYFPGRNHGSLDVVWTAGEGASRVGVLNFGSKWDSAAVILVASDGEHIRQADIKPVLDAKVNAFMKTALKGKKGVDPSRYAIAYSELKAGGFDKITLNFDAQVPKDEDAPFVAGAMTVALETSGDKPSAKVLNVTARKE
ncbi:MAG: hypothetical protein ACJ8KU_03375 [Chthoniobacterales bacterium]